MESKAKCSWDSVFLRILDGDFSKKLTMPSTFTKQFNGEVPSWLLLEISGARRCWRVDVENDATGTLYFTNGWDEFVEANGLDVGNILLFEHQTPLIFDVIIFDKDGFEKSVDQITEPEAYRTEDSDHQHGTSHKPHPEEASRFSSRTDKSTLPNKYGFQKTVDQTSEFQAYENEDSEHHHETVNTCHAEDSTDNARQVVDAFERKTARVSVSKSGVAFSTTWRNTNHLYYYLTIPKAVATNMNLSSQKKVILTDQEENSWPIELRVRLDGRVDLAQGWREFLYDKKITVGDMLTFEFHSNILIHVNVECPAQADHPSHSASQSPSGFFNMAFEHVEPAVNYDGNHQTPETSQNSESVRFKFRRSSFPITWRETTHAEFLIIPKSVAEEQKLVNNQSIVVCDEGGKLWHMAVKVSLLLVVSF